MMVFYRVGGGRWKSVNWYQLKIIVRNSMPVSEMLFSKKQKIGPKEGLKVT